MKLHVAHWLPAVGLAVGLAGGLAGCGPAAQGTPEPSGVQSEPTHAPVEVTHVGCSPDPHPDQYTPSVVVRFTIKNESEQPALYRLKFAVDDHMGVQVGSLDVDFGTIEGPLAPGRAARYSDAHGLYSGSVPAEFTCSLVSVIASS